MPSISVLAIALIFIAAGIGHFVWPEMYVRIMPPYLPAPMTLVYISGFFEILGGVGVLLPGYRVYAGWGLIILLLAVFPANVHMALHPGDFSKIPGWALWARLPLQFVLIAWVYYATCRT
ncbi:hypothetical protein CRI94_04230 [Longibacter salinarum]|uniref:DoxX family protein n=1 Tax=Longibacter salinarum TaxID=1850348 RepID=A0A2A8D087_9BACT|nr:DoxX family protein [Longibacter salinarum]PEN14253.1 hypothetical protein CRI94_04230 [Longibacter salinarum]